MGEVNHSLARAKRAARLPARKKRLTGDEANHSPAFQQCPKIIMVLFQGSLHVLTS